jgi:hypothetical protein
MLEMYIKVASLPSAELRFRDDKWLTDEREAVFIFICNMNMTQNILTYVTHLTTKRMKLHLHGAGPYQSEDDLLVVTQTYITYDRGGQTFGLSDLL